MPRGQLSRSQRRPEVALDQEHRAAGPSGVCSQVLGSEFGGDPTQLFRRATAGSRVARGEHDLDVRTE